MNNTHQDKERKLITLNGQKRPYGAKITFQIQHTFCFGDLINVTLLLDSGAIATITPDRSASWEGNTRLQVSLEGFATATKAESEGTRFAQALLFSAVSLNIGLRLNYHSQEPAIVFERFPSTGLGLTVYGEGVSGWSQQVVLNEIIGAYNNSLIDNSFILSMELYCAALLEPYGNARFITLVSALEPIAKQEDLGSSVSSFVDSALMVLSEAKDIETSLIDSLKGRVNLLRKESIRQALKRLSNSWFPNRKDVWQVIDRAYALRSELLHEGKLNDPDIDLFNETILISNILRAIYEKALDRKLHVSAPV